MGLEEEEGNIRKLKSVLDEDVQTNFASNNIVNVWGT